jgi:hypothetical protein
LTSTNLTVTAKKYLELHYGCKKVKEYEENDLKNLFKFILALCKLIGVTEAPDNEIILLLIDHIQEHHKDFSKEEIQKAFSMATAGKLGFDFVHYNRITPQLISSTLNKYKALRSKEIIAFESKLNQEEDDKRREANQPTPKERIVINVKSCVENFNRFSIELNKQIEKRNLPIDWGGLNYVFLEKIGLINYTKEIKIEIRELAKKKLIKEKRKKQNSFSKLNIGSFMKQINSDNPPAQLINESRQIALNRYFDSLIENKLTLSTEIKNKLLNHEDKKYVEVGNLLYATNRKGN